MSGAKRNNLHAVTDIRERRRSHFISSISIGEIIATTVLLTSTISSLLWTQFLANQNAENIKAIRADIKDMRREIIAEIKEIDGRM